MPPLTIDNLGEGGVDVDTNPTQTADNTTSECQNATYDSTRKRLGGLTKRPGLSQFNTVKLGGIVLGGSDAAYTGTAQATGGGGGGIPGDTGDTGSSDGGDAAGGNAPGDSGSGGGFTEGLTGGTGKLFNGARLICVGRSDNTIANQYGHGWYITSDGFSDTASLTTVTASTSGTTVAIGPPSESGSLTGFPSQGQVGQPAFVVVNNVLYYAQAHDETASTSPTLPNLAAFDGKVDTILAGIPDNPFILALATIPSHIISVLSFMRGWGDQNIIYFSTCDRITTGGSAGRYGRVFKFEVASGKLTEIFNSMNTYDVAQVNNSIPYILFAFLGHVWTGQYTGTGGSNKTAIWRLQPDTLSYDGFKPVDVQAFNSSNSTLAGVTCARVYKGSIYFGTESSTSGGNTDFAIVWKVPGDNSVAATNSLTASGGIAVDQNYFVSMRIFKGNLYASYYNPTQTAKIYKFDGTTWTTAFTSGGAGSRVPLNLATDGDDTLADTSTQTYLYAFSGLGLGGTQEWLVTTDGSTWTNKDSNFSSPNQSYPINVLFGVDQ